MATILDTSVEWLEKAQKDGKCWKTFPAVFVPRAHSLVFPVEPLGDGSVADNTLKAAVDMENSAFKSSYFNNL